MEPDERSARRAADRLLVRTARAARGWWVVLAIDTLAGALLTLAAPVLLAVAVDATVGATADRHRAVMALAALAAAGIVVSVIGQIATAYGTARGDIVLRRRLVDRVLDLGLAGQRRFAPGDVVSRLNASVPHAAAVVPKVLDAAAGVLVAVVALVALARLDWWIVVVIALATPFVFFIVRVLMRETALSTVAYQEHQAEVATRFVAALRGARTIRACDTVDREIARVSEPLAALEAAGRAVWQTLGRTAGRAGLVVPLVGVGALAVAGQGVAAGRLTPGELIAATGYVPIALGLFDHVSNLGSLAVDRACAVRVAEVLASPTAPVGTSRLGPGRGVLALRGVGVALDGRRLLGPLDLDVAGGTTVAIVGHSGAGKSILALVAGGLWTPDEGSVELDGVALGDLTPADRAGAVAFAFDVPHLVGRTIADALAYGHPATRVELYRSLDQAQATAFVERLPGGLDAPLSTAPFSGGEHQRLGLARALLRRPRLLVLDDATSSLDTVTEALVQDTITGAAAQSTTLVVAHRVSSAARADRVVWVDGTTVRRTGTHRELWADADYRALFAADEAEPVVLGRPA